MSLEAMQARLDYNGGKFQQDRMIKDKLRSLRTAIKHSYQSARFRKYPAEDAEIVGLFNPVTQNQDFDTKMISTEFSNGYKVGDVFKWCNTGVYWIIYQWDRTELAYFRGECRRCDWRTRWVDKDQKECEAILSVIGPSATQLRTSSSQQAKLAEDFPNANLMVLVTDNEANRAYFGRYQRFILKGVTYMVENIDNLSMPGVIQIAAYEYYANGIEDDIENDRRNTWNIMPVLTDEHKYPTDYGIEGPNVIKPLFEYEFRAVDDGGFWLISENEGRRGDLYPAEIIENNHAQRVIHVKWTAKTRGGFTIEYRKPDVAYKLYVLVESLM